MSRTIDLRKICLTAINTALNTVISLLTGIKSKTDQLTFNGDKLKVDASVSIDTSDLAKETTLQSVLNAIEEIEINAENINLNTDQLEAKIDETNALLTSLDGKDYATETKQDAQIILATALNGYVDGLETLLNSLNNKDFASETTLNLIKGYVDGIETLLNAILVNTNSLNLEATQLLIKSVLDNIKAKTDNLDVLLSSRASETTLIQVRDYLDTVENKLNDLINKDFATEQTQILNKNLLTDIKGFFTNLYNQVNNWLAVKVINTVNVNQVATTTSPISVISNFTEAGIVFSYSAEINAASSGVDNPLILIRNPNGNTKKLSLYFFSAGVALTNVQAELLLYANPTVTANGTVQTPANNYIGSGTSSTMQLYTLPTISSLGTKLRDLTFGQNNNSLIISHNGEIVLPPNNSLLFCADPASNNRPVAFSIVWTEINL